MTYYFPYGYTPESTFQVNSTNIATTASFTASAATVINAAQYAPVTQSPGVEGPKGPTRDPATCPALDPGTTGLKGDTGDPGPPLLDCPPGSILCPNLTPPAGYSLVCMETGSCTGVPACPTVLP